MSRAPKAFSFDAPSWFSLSSAVAAAASLMLGFAIFAFLGGPRTLLASILGTAALVGLLLYPELALALYVVIGDVKGDDRVASLFPVDLTLLLGGILVAGILLNFIRKKPAVPMPRVYFLFLVLLAWMAASLSYTPVFGAGLEKLGRFLSVTSIVIVAPFAVLSSPRAMKRFLAGFSIAAFAICGYSLLSLGGSDRLVTPSDNTIGLGHIACALIILLWFTVVPRFHFPERMATYLLLVVPAIALIGSGSRGSAIACIFVLGVSLLFYRKLLLDVGILAGTGLLIFPFLKIPESSIEYLGTLIRSRSVAALMSFRGDLLDYGWKLLTQHPLWGAGIQGFRYRSPNPGVYNWPHNIFLETACELGIPAFLVLCAIFGSAIREAFRQLRDGTSQHFTLSQLAAALFAIGIVNAMNTGDINSDRSTWLFMSLVFVVSAYGRNPDAVEAPAAPAGRAAVAAT
jgi:O-antigen ligase